MGCNEQVELKSGATGPNGETVESILSDGATVVAPANGAALIAGLDPAALTTQRTARVNAAGELLVSAAVVLPPLTSVAINDAGAGVTEASVKPSGVAFTDGSLASGGRDTGGLQYPLPLEGGGVASRVSGLPGTVIAAQVDTAVGAAAVAVPLPVTPAGTRRVTVQRTDNTANTFIRVREVGGAAGAGLKLGPLGAVTFGGADGAVQDLEVDGDGANPTTVGVLFEQS